MASELTISGGPGGPAPPAPLTEEEEAAFNVLVGEILEKPEKILDIELSAEQLLELQRRLNPYGGVAAPPTNPERHRVAVCSYTNLREDYLRRLTMTSAAAPALPPAQDEGRKKMMSQYGARSGADQGAEDRCIAILKGLTAQLRRQQEAGSGYLVGDRLSLCDIHWACFSQLVGALGPEHFTMPDQMRAIYSTLSERLGAALDPVLMEHRDRIWREHIGLPYDC